MYLTRMELDTNKRKCVIALKSPNLFHGAIEEAFPERGRKLWRLDTLAGKRYLLLVSEEKPDLTDAVRQFGTEAGWESRKYSPFLEQIRNGDRRRFRVTANPVITKSAGTGNAGSVLAHVTPVYQEKWLADRAEKNGFLLEPERFSAVSDTWVTFRKGSDHGRTVSFRAVTFEGELTVTDANLFRELLVNGLGREKAYGCGLLTVTGAICE